MKKLLTVLLTLLMVFTLVGCNSKEDTPVVQEPEKQEVVEETKEEPEIVGGYVEVEDGTLTDELKDIFDSALEGLLGASYEPVELVATQVVAGTNYKFKANGTKTTNPITKGTYFIYVNKDLQGKISLLDIEVIEEKQEEVKTQDVTQMSFWVVFYDQYGNELQRTVEKYGTIPSFKDALPEGFEKWVYKKSQKDVETFKPITTNTYFESVCHAVHYGSSSPSPSSACSNTNDLYYVNGNPFSGIGGDWAASYLFKYISDSFVAIEYDSGMEFSKQASGDSVLKDHWYHLDNGTPVECTDPNHHGISYIPLSIEQVIATIGDIFSFDLINSISSSTHCKFDSYNLLFTDGQNVPQSIATKTALTKADNNWKYENSDVMINFVMNSEVLSFVYVQGKSTSWNPYSGFYQVPTN